METPTETTLINSQMLEKVPSGVQGLDEILQGGLPKGRTTLVCGGPGCGKTLLATTFLIEGAVQYDEPGVFMAFEETREELAKNVASLGIDLNELIEQKKIFVDHVHIDRREIEETGDYDLEGLFLRLGLAIDQIGAKRVVLDTLEMIFAGFANEAILRSEIRRLFRWLKDKGVSAVVTGEKGEKTLTRYGLEEYVSDCVILLDNRVNNKIASRLLRVIKYRGTEHANDEFPFIIGEKGIWVMPVTSSGLTYQVSQEFIPSGVPRLDTMLSSKGFYRGSTVMISGSAGTGKTSLAAAMVDAACSRGERCLYFAFEESPQQIIRNMRSIGYNLQDWVDQGFLQITAHRPSMFGLEQHLLTMQYSMEQFAPSVIVFDPLTNLISVGSLTEVKSMLVRLIDWLKNSQITSVFTSLTKGDGGEETSEIGISSLMDVWILVRNLETNGERNRGLYILKARGMAHSTQVREFRLSSEGIQIIDVYTGPEGVLTGSARQAWEAHQRFEDARKAREFQRQKRDLEQKVAVTREQIKALTQKAQWEEEELQYLLQNESQRQAVDLQNEADMADFRQADKD